ncbi:hypothetical protein HX99_01985 [Peptococcaceae bacterium SCADC1_2_3]|nr:hypothetical protein HX99_01985 [Peptococcaceae bacterium SCADC1_2_3]
MGSSLSKTTGKNPREGGKLAMTHESGNLPGHILVRMHPPIERAVPGQVLIIFAKKYETIWLTP